MIDIVQRISAISPGGGDIAMYVCIINIVMVLEA